MEFRFGNGSQAYLYTLAMLLDDGAPVSPRGKPCRELTDVTISIRESETAVPVGTARKINSKIGATEYVQLLAGASCLESLDEASGGRFSQFANDGRLEGAYGPRVYHQALWVADILDNDEDTRQAVLSIWGNEGREIGRSRADVPCTVSVQFRIRDQKLHCTVIMRSSDAWLGIPYDWWQWSRFQMTLAAVLGRLPGSFTFFAGSLHLYDSDIEKARQVVAAGHPEGSHAGYTEPELYPPCIWPVEDEISSAANRMQAAQKIAEKVMLGQEVSRVTDIGAKFYARLVPPVPAGLKICSMCRYAAVLVTGNPQECMRCACF